MKILQDCKNTIKQLRISHPEIFTEKKNHDSQPKQTIKNLPSKFIQKPSIDLAVDIDIDMDSLNTYTASTSPNNSETNMNNQILEVFRQAKEIIEHYSNQQVQKI